RVHGPHPHPERAGGGCRGRDRGRRRSPRRGRDSRRDPERHRARHPGRRGAGLAIGAPEGAGMGVGAASSAAGRHRRRQPLGRRRSRGDGAGPEGPLGDGGVPGRRLHRGGDARCPVLLRGSAQSPGGRRFLTRRAWAVGILVAWAGSLGWLAWRELFRPTSARLAEAALSVPPGAVYYRLDIGGQQVGFASSTIDTAGSAIRVEDVLVLDVPALGVLHRTTAQSRATLSRALRLEDVNATFDGDVGRFSSHGTVTGDTALSIWLVAGGDSEFTRVPLSRPIVLPTLLPLRLAFGGELQPGKTYSVRVFDPLLLAVRDVGVTIAAESTLVVADSADYDSTAMAWVPVHFDTVRAFRIEQVRDGVRGSAWIDAAGHIVRATSPVAFTQERSALEIASENFRRRDTARVARATAPPRVGDVVPTTAIAAGARLLPAATPELRVRLSGGDVRGLHLAAGRQRLVGDTLVVRGGAGTVTSSRCGTSRWRARWGCRPAPLRDSYCSTGAFTITPGRRCIWATGSRWIRRPANSPPTPRTCASSSAAWPAKWSSPV